MFRLTEHRTNPTYNLCTARSVSISKTANYPIASARAAYTQRTLLGSTQRYWRAFLGGRHSKNIQAHIVMLRLGNHIETPSLRRHSASMIKGSASNILFPVYRLTYEANDDTCSSTTFLICASISGVMLPLEISWSRAPWVAVR